MQDREAAISARAHQLWEESGQAHGQHEQHWRQAEREYDKTEAHLAEAAKTVPAKPTRKETAKAAESATDVAPTPTRKPRAPRKGAGGIAIN